MLERAFHPWAAEARLQATGRLVLRRMLLWQLAAVWAAWLDFVQARHLARPLGDIFCFSNAALQCNPIYSSGMQHVNEVHLSSRRGGSRQSVPQTCMRMQCCGCSKSPWWQHLPAGRTSLAALSTPGGCCGECC